LNVKKKQTKNVGNFAKQSQNNNGNLQNDEQTSSKKSMKHSMKSRTHQKNQEKRANAKCTKREERERERESVCVCVSCLRSLCSATVDFPAPLRNKRSLFLLRASGLSLF